MPAEPIRSYALRMPWPNYSPLVRFRAVGDLFMRAPSPKNAVGTSSEDIGPWARSPLPEYLVD